MLDKRVIMQFSGRNILHSLYFVVVKHVHQDANQVVVAFAKSCHINECSNITTHNANNSMNFELLPSFT